MITLVDESLRGINGDVNYTQEQRKQYINNKTGKYHEANYKLNVNCGIYSDNDFI